MLCVVHVLPFLLQWSSSFVILARVRFLRFSPHFLCHCRAPIVRHVFRLSDSLFTSLFCFLLWDENDPQTWYYFGVIPSHGSVAPTQRLIPVDYFYDNAASLPFLSVSSFPPCTSHARPQADGITAPFLFVNA